MTSRDRTFSSSNSRVLLSIDPPVAPHDSYQPGSRLRAIVEAKPGRHFQLALIGQAFGTLKGGGRWRSSVVNGAAEMSGSSQQDDFIFLNTLFRHLPSQEISESVEDGRTKYHYELAFPERVRHLDECLPSFKLDRGHSKGSADVVVKYSVDLEGVRNGFLKTNDKLSIEVPVSIPLRPPIPAVVPRELWPPKTSQTELSYSGPDGSHPILEAKLSFHLLSSNSQPLFISLSLSFPASSTSLFTSPPTITASLLRTARTSAVNEPLASQYNWPRIKILKVEMQNSDIKELEWTGKIEIPKGEKTLRSRRVGMEYTLSCKVEASGLSSPLVVDIPVFLPSSSQLAAATNKGAATTFGA